MSFVRQSQRTNSPLPRHENKQEELVIQNDDKRTSKKELAHVDLNEQLTIAINKMLSTYKTVSSDQFLEPSYNKQRRSSTLSSDSSYQIDKLLQDENNDWFFERILEKFEDLRSKKSDRYTGSLSNEFNDDFIHGGERIIERRYYVKKPKPVSKRNRLTSTGDLSEYGRKNRQYSGVSSVTAATTTCSQCRSTTPTYVENLRDQSDSLRNEISELKIEIEQLQTSQQEFFQQLRAQFPSKTDSTDTTTPPKFAPPTISPPRSSSGKNETVSIIPITLTTTQRSRSISTESLASSSTISSGQTTPKLQPPTGPIVAPFSVPVAPTPHISEFMAIRNPSIAPTPPVSAYVSSKPSLIGPIPPVKVYVTSKPSAIAPKPPVNAHASSKSSSLTSTPPVNAHVSSKSSSLVPTPPVNAHDSSKPSSIAPTPSVNAHVSSKSSSIAPTPPVNAHASSKSSSIAPTPPVNAHINSKPSSIASTPPITAHVSSKPSSIAPTPPITEFALSKNPAIALSPSVVVPIEPVNSRTSPVTPTPPATASPMLSARTPIYENELAHQRLLLPRSEIVASSASIQESSDSSSGSVSPELVQHNPQQIPKVPVTPLRDNDLQDLVQYSSQVGLSSFTPSITPIITNPNTSIAFWESVDQFIENSKSANIPTGLPPVSRSNNENRLGLYNSTPRQLDKYDLERKAQEIIASSAPFLMPPFDIYHN